MGAYRTKGITGKLVVVGFLYSNFLGRKALGSVVRWWAQRLQFHMDLSIGIQYFQLQCEVYLCLPLSGFYRYTSPSEQWKQTGCLGYIGDETLPSYKGILINKFNKDPYEPISINSLMGCDTIDASEIPNKRLRCIEPYEEWNILHINWLAGFLDHQQYP